MLLSAAMMLFFATAEQPSSPADRDQIVCKRQLLEGTRKSGKICKTKGEWSRDKMRFRDAIEKKQRDSLLNN